MSQQSSGGQADQRSSQHSKPLTEARAAAYALVGAIVGGLATLGGAYWTGHQAQSEAQVVAERSAYINFAAVAYQVATNLSLLTNASSNHDQASYTAARDRIIADVGPLNSDAVSVELLAPLDIAYDAESVVNILFKVNLPSSVNALNRTLSHNAVNDFLKAMSHFQSAAHAQLDH